MSKATVPQSNIRNIAIIAHVDHGKTSLVDGFIRQSHIFRENQEEMHQEMLLDSGELEREKGITIKAKNIAVNYKDYKINIIDTPGHADFGGEVERTLNMAEGCILVVDAQEGPMPQTKFVLKRALELGLKPMVLVNKLDKPNQRALKVVEEVSDLFLELATDDSQLDFPVLFGVGREGRVWEKLPEGDLTQSGTFEGSLIPLLDKIIEYIPAPTGDEKAPLQMQVSSFEYDPHLGRYLIGKIKRGVAKKGASIAVVKDAEDDEPALNMKGKIEKILVREGLGYTEVNEGGAGEIVAIAGVNSNVIGATLCDANNPEALPTIKISPPSVKIKFEANTSPLVGKEGKFVTMKLIQQRLEQEKEKNISLKIENGDGGSYYVAGRGELQLAILIEEMRREGFEFQIRKPEVVYKMVDGKKHEPVEELTIEVPEEFTGAVTEILGQRGADMIEMKPVNSQTRFTYKILTRNLLGLRGLLLPATKGNLIFNSYLMDYVPYTEQKELFRRGALISSDSGEAKGYALNTIQDRGELFIDPATKVYQGMVIGINKFENDMEVSATKQRKKTAVRMNAAEVTLTKLKQHKDLSLEFALSFLAKDEMLEVTPENLRIRKVYLTDTERKWASRTNLTAFAKQQMGVS